MNKLIKLTIQYQKENSNELFNDIIEIIIPIIRHRIRDIPSMYQEDVLQEILMKVDRMLKKFKITNHNVSDKFVNNFLTKYQDIINEFESEYEMFCAENQLLTYIVKICNSSVNDYYRQHKNNTVSLNQKDKNEIELIEMIQDKNADFMTFCNRIDLSNDEHKIMDLIMKEERISQKEIGKILGISQQAVSKRLKKIKNKFR